jgi:hypothetical protein
MKLLMTAWLLSVLVGAASRASDVASNTKAFLEAEKRLRELTASLPDVEQTFSNDPEGLLGLAVLYDRYASSRELAARSDGLYRKVIDMEPQNKAAFMQFALHQVVEFTSRRMRLLDQLEIQRQYALSNNIQEVESPVEGHELFEWLREREDQQSVTIRNFEEARSRLIEKLDRDLPTVLSILEKGKTLDPDNAAYNYLEASLDFDLGENEAALLEVERGASKLRLESYVTQILSARRKVLQAAKFPDKDREMTEKYGQGGAVFVDDRKIFKMAEEYEAKRDFANATRVHQIMIKAADQLRQEPVAGRPGGKRGDNELSRRIEAKARRALARIRNGTK